MYGLYIYIDFLLLSCQTQMFHFQARKKKGGKNSHSFEMKDGRDRAGPIWLCQFLYDIIIPRVINSGMLRSPTTTT